MRFVFLFLILLVTLQTNASVNISEVMTCNVSTYLDRNSWNFPGYVELYNSGDEDVSLKGYKIIHYNKKSKGNYKYKWEWIIPYDFVVKSKSYNLLFFDKDSTKAMHSSKKLDSDGGQICLYSGDVLLDEFFYEAMEAHIAYGVGENGDVGYMVPSPMKMNGASYSSLKNRVTPVYFKGASPGYQDSSITVSLACDTKNVSIYYTTDGSEPTINSLVYNDSTNILLDSTVCIKARAYSNSLLPSKILSGTFIFMDSAHSSCGGFSVPIVSISVDDKYLYDDSLGIAVTGVNGILGNCTTYPANFNQDWERPAVFEYFVDGKRQVCEEVEIGVSGGCTRSYTNIPKSLKIKTGKKIGSNKEYLDYDFFKDKLGNRYKSLKIRAGGNANDAFSLRFRDGYFHSLAREMNVDYQAYQPVSYYLNGIYQGMMGLREHLNEDYIVSNYGLDEDDLDMIKTHEQKAGDKLAYNKMVSFLDNNDPNDSLYFRTVCEMMDVEEYIDYMIIEQFSANADWPGNNIMCWRDRHNGKFRWILYDLDVTMGCSPSDVSVDPIKWCTGDVEEKTWANNEKWKVVIFSNLIKNPQFKKRFINRWMMYLGTTLSKQNIESVYDSLATVVDGEFCATFDGLSPLDCPGRAFLMKKVNERTKVVLSSLGNLAGYKWNVGLSFSANLPGVKFEMNEEIVNKSSFSGYWFNSGELTLKAIAPANYRFVRWDVKLADSTYSVKEKVFKRIIKKKCEITAIFDTCDCQVPTVVINEMCASPDSSTTILDDYGLSSDWVELYNYGEDTVDVAGLYLTDKTTNLTKYQIPYSYETTKIAPHDYLMVWADGMSYRGAMHANFKLENKTGAKLALSQRCGDSIIVLDQVAYKKMPANASYGRILDFSEDWTSFSPYKDTLTVDELLFVTPGRANGSESAALLVCPSDTMTRKFFDGVELRPNAFIKGNANDIDFSIEYSTDEGLSWNYDAPGIVNCDTVNVMVRVVHPNYKTVECGYEMSIAEAEMNFICPGDTIKVYDGESLDVVAYAEGIRPEDTITVEYSKDDGTTWDTVAPAMNGVGVQNVMVRAVCPNYKTVKRGYEMSITEAEMNLICPGDTIKVYDGESLDVVAYAEGIRPEDTITVEYSKDEGVTWDTVAPVMNGVGVQNVMVRAIHPNYKTRECGYEMTITEAEMNLICPGDTIKEYDGESLDVVAYAEGIRPEDTITVEYSKDEGVTWDTVAPVMNGVGVQNVMVRAIHPNYKTRECGYEMTITEAEMNLICPTDTTKVHEGEKLDVVAYAEGVSENDEIVIEYSAEGGNEWYSVPPILLDTGTITMNVRATHMNYKMAECKYNLIIAKDDVSVELLDSDSYLIGDEYRIYDMSGRLVRKGDSLENLVGGLSGIYLCRVYDHGICIGAYRILE
jgi:hypothetical protein